jgi:hypothetical protein
MCWLCRARLGLEAEVFEDDPFDEEEGGTSGEAQTADEPRDQDADSQAPQAR